MSIDRPVSVLSRGVLSLGCCGAGLLLEGLFDVELQLIHLLKVEFLWKGSSIRHCKVIGFLWVLWSVFLEPKKGPMRISEINSCFWDSSKNSHPGWCVQLMP